MSKIQYSLEEIISYLERSHLPTLLTEGKDDYSLFRNVEIAAGSVDCLPAGGKKFVIDALNSSKSDVKDRTGFLVDQDLWFLDEKSRIDDPHLIVTMGYSIENDLLADAKAESLIYPDQMQKYLEDIDMAIDWFSAAASHKLKYPEYQFPSSYSQIIDSSKRGMADTAKQMIEMAGVDSGIRKIIESDHKKYLRGKNWKSILSHYLCASDRQIQHNPLALMEHALRNSGPNSELILAEIRKKCP